MKPTLKAPGTEHLKLKYDVPLSNFAFKFHLRRYTKGDDLLGMPLTYDYFDYVGDNYVKETQPLIDASPSFIGNALTCELLKEDKRTVMLSQTFDFEHVMRHCHLHDDPGVAGKESAIFKKEYTRRRLLGGQGDIHTTKEQVIPYIQKFTPKKAVGAKQCCVQSGDWKFCIFSSEIGAGDSRVTVPAPPKPTVPPRPPTVVSSFSDTAINTLLPAGVVTKNTVESYGGSCAPLKQTNNEFVKFLSGWHLAAADEPIPSPPPTGFQRKRSRRHLQEEFKADDKENLQPPSPPRSPPPSPPPPVDPGRRFVAGCKDVKAGTRTGTL